MGSSLYSSSFPCGCGAGGGGGGGGTPGGLSGQVQFNSGGAFGGSNDFTYDGDRVVIKSLLITGTGFIEHISDLYIGDPLLTLNSGVSSPNTYDIGFIGDQGGGGTNNIGFIWDVDNTEFAFIGTTDDGSTKGNVTIDSYKDIKAETVIATTATFTNQISIGGRAPLTGEISEVLSSVTGCAASKSCEFFTGSVLGYGTGNSQTFDDGDILKWDAGTTSWSLVQESTAGTPGGSNTDIQFNNAGALGGSSSLTWNGTTQYINGALGVGTSTPTTVGLIRATNDVVAFYSSDERLKENISPIEDSLNKIQNINGVEFDWVEKNGVHENEGHDIGVIAQEVEKIAPEIVTTRDNGYKAVRYEKIVPLLIEAIKDQQAQIDELKKALQ